MFGKFKMFLPPFQFWHFLLELMFFEDDAVIGLKEIQ